MAKKPKDKKHLQKLTDFEKLKTSKMVREYLKENPKDVDLLLDNLENRINESYKMKQGNEYLLENLIVACQKFGNNVDMEADLRNATYEMNHSLITNCLHNEIIKNRCFPTMQSIATETGLSRNTIYKHLNDGLRSKYNKLVTGKLEYMTLSALASLYHIGINDRNATALKNFIELAGNTKNSNNTVNNYIQINNLKLSKEEFEKLPEDVILEVEEIISKNLKI